MATFTKVFEVTLNFPNSIDACRGGLENRLLSAISDQYIGRCFKGAFILEILSIIDHGGCRIIMTNTTAHGYVDVSFLARVKSYCKWDIIIVTIVVHNHMLVGVVEPSEGLENLRVVVTIVADKAAESIAVGQKVPVRIIAVNHNAMQSQISVVGAILICDKKIVSYKLQGAINSSIRGDILPIYNAVLSELNVRAGLIETNKAELFFFERLLYSYKFNVNDLEEKLATANGNYIWQGPSRPDIKIPDSKEINMLDIIGQALEGKVVKVDGIWSRSLSIFRSSPLLTVNAEESPGQTICEGSPNLVFATFLKNMLDLLTATHQLVLTYKTKKMVDSHRNLWAIMGMAQYPLPNPQ